jgi:hypothetical protein
LLIKKIIKEPLSFYDEGSFSILKITKTMKKKATKKIGHGGKRPNSGRKPGKKSENSKKLTSFKIKPSIINRLGIISEKLQKSKTAILEQAVEEFFEKIDEK